MNSPASSSNSLTEPPHNGLQNAQSSFFAGDFEVMDLLELEATHNHEEKLRRESLRLSVTDHELRRRLQTIEKAMVLIYGYTIDYIANADDERTIQLFGVRLFNAAASGVKLALSGYYQIAFQQTRVIMEIGFLLDYFRTSPDKIRFWKALDGFSRRKYFSPSKIRNELDERDGDNCEKRRTQHHELSELAWRATYQGFAAQLDVAQFGPFLEKNNLKVWADQMVLKLGASALMYATHFPEADTALKCRLGEFATEFDRGTSINGVDAS
jgi:hypothetical protein